MSWDGVAVEGTEGGSCDVVDLIVGVGAAAIEGHGAAATASAYDLRGDDGGAVEKDAMGTSPGSREPLSRALGGVFAYGAIGRACRVKQIAEGAERYQGKRMRGKRASSAGDVNKRGTRARELRGILRGRPRSSGSQRSSSPANSPRQKTR